MTTPFITQKFQSTHVQMLFAPDDGSPQGAAASGAWTAGLASRSTFDTSDQFIDDRTL